LAFGGNPLGVGTIHANRLRTNPANDCGEGAGVGAHAIE
jgi:hypothetical protein